ncbi:MAG: FkbM family methyltransferase [Acidobacteriaceae bacterium]|nr:FkbM family methyltransferase [Acidobacteriaceae bacterium]
MSYLATLQAILNHPLNANNKQEALMRYLRWQIGCRMLPGTATVVPFINQTCLAVSPGMTGATMHIYTGLSDFPDCGFLMHLLRPGDLFADVGANVGVYSILAAGVAGARAVSMEPIPSTYQKMLVNVAINQLQSLVTTHNIGLGKATEKLRFTSDRDTANRIITDAEYQGPTIDVPVRRLDDVLAGEAPILIKLDVEGWESVVLTGAEAVLQNPSLLGWIVEMNGDSAEFDANERATHDCMLRHGFAPYAYDPFTRKLKALPSKHVGYTNTIYLRNMDEVQRRIAAGPAFRVREQTI